VDGLVLLSYPLHPPDKPQKLRVEHLPQIQIPTLCFEGTRDPFCTPEILVSATKDLPNFEVVWFEGADHSLHAPKIYGRTDKDMRSQIAAKVASWAEGV